MCTGIYNPDFQGNRNVLSVLTLLMLFLLAAAGCDRVVSEQAQSRFRARSGPFSVTVFPVQVTTGSQVDHDKALAKRFSEFLRSSQLAVPRLSSRSIKKPPFFSISETKRIRLNARYLIRTVDAMDLDTDYAFMAEIVCNPNETRVLGVYFFLSDRFGRIASARMANTHHREFRRIHPENRNDGFRVLREMIREGWIQKKP